MQFRYGRNREAITFLERAVELDPQFFSAYRMLSNVYVNLGDGQAAKENSAKAFELKDRRVTQEENFRATVFII